MGEASIPVNVFNPGQVFASIGFLEAADVLCGGATGKFDQVGTPSFKLKTNDDGNPFRAVLNFVAEADVTDIRPTNLMHITSSQNDNVFPSAKIDKMALPVRLQHKNHVIELSHWCDGSSREAFKLYAGNRSALQIVQALLGTGTGYKGVRALWEENADKMVRDPFDILTPMGGKFNFDPRGGWTAIDVGYSPNDVKHGVCASPVVEILAAIGLEHARPLIDNKQRQAIEKQRVTYAIWDQYLSPILARPVFGGASLGIPSQRFYFYRSMSGKNKITRFAKEEV